MKTPLVDLASQNRTIETELRAAIDRVLQSQCFILGPEVEAFEAEMARFAGAKHSVGVSNGSDALVAALLALEVGSGDEVIVPTFTFFATAGSVWRVGAKPVFVDVLPDTFNIDPDGVAAAITERTRAIIPVHLYGQCADMERILAAAKQHDLPVIEDAAQAIGATYRDRSAGSLGTMGAFSFYPTKNLSAIGEAGMVLTNDDELARRLRCIRNHGQGERYEHDRIGANYRLDAIQAAALRVKLARLPEWTQARRRNAARYDEAFSDATVTPPPVDDQCGHVYHQYTIRSAQRDAIRTRLADAGIGSGIYYPIPLHLQPCFRELGYVEGSFPVAERAAQEVLSLPVSPEMNTDQQTEVIDVIRRCAPK